MSIADKLTQIAANEQKVFDAGKQAEYDRFWDTLQDYGKRTNYRNGLGGLGWNDDNFRPKYNLTINEGYQAFASTGIVDLAQTLENAGVTMSEYPTANGQYLFWQSPNLKRIPVLMVSNGDTWATAYGMFSNCPKLETIDGIILGEQKNESFWTGTFDKCTSLRNIEIDGVITKSVNFQWSPLTGDSMRSIISALSPTETGRTVTVNKTAKEAAFTESEWAELIAPKSNWTFSLV